jgi:hypothetical protein
LDKGGTAQDHAAGASTELRHPLVKLMIGPGLGHQPATAAQGLTIFEWFLARHKERTEARAFFEEVVRRYPDTGWAQEAKEKLKE